MSWESDDCDCAEDWTCMRHRGELLTMSKQGGTMTDEELHQMEIRYSDMESFDDAKRLLVEVQFLRAAAPIRDRVLRAAVDRLRTENQRLVEAIEAFLLDHPEHNHGKLRAAIEGK